MHTIHCDLIQLDIAPLQRGFRPLVIQNSDLATAGFYPWLQGSIEGRITKPPSPFHNFIFAPPEKCQYLLPVQLFVSIFANFVHYFQFYFQNSYCLFTTCFHGFSYSSFHIPDKWHQLIAPPPPSGGGGDVFSNLYTPALLSITIYNILLLTDINSS